MKKLQLGFKAEGGSHRSLTLNFFKEDLEANEIKAAMQQISDTKLFVKDDEELYHEPVSAKYITKTEEIIF